MKYINTFLIILVLFTGAIYSAQKSDILSKFEVGKIKGVIKDNENKPLVGANVILLNTSIGTSTNDNGEFEVTKIPVGSYKIVVSMIGYKSEQQQIKIRKEKTTFVELKLESGSLEVETVVVTGTRTEKKRRESAVIVNSLSSKMFDKTQSNFLSEGLNFQPGVRVEIDCQTCNYSQVRLNGLGGSYSQILINSRPIFSPLNGLYGLEQIPKNMIERVEVLRGGGSALFGASAIGGTINVITREPIKDNYSMSINNSIIDGVAQDRNININSSIISDDFKSGLSFFGIFRDRNEYDSNGDGFSEIPKLKNNSFGINSFIKPSTVSKISLDVHSIHEKRRGGNKNDLPAHQADQSEDRVHNILGGGLTYEHDFIESKSKIAVYASGQYTDREHYTGIDHVDAYGTTENMTYVGGVQFNKDFENFLDGETNTLVMGFETVYDDVMDVIPGYNHLVDQITRQFGGYLQSDWKINNAVTLLLGLRGDKHSLLDEVVFSPRANLMYNITPDMQLRTSFSTGFRAPQAFDADLHIAFSGGGISRIVISPELKKERSISYSASLDFNDAHVDYIYGFTVEAFYTKLFDAFVLEDLGADPTNLENTILERRNGGEAEVAGISLSARMNYNNFIEFDLGATFQSSLFDEAVEWSEELPGTKEFLRTPKAYGYFTVGFNPYETFKIAVSGVLTGPMLVPHVAGAPGVENDELVKSDTFLDTNIKFSYIYKTESFFQDMEIFAGIQNIFDQYQDDFDIGKNRDSNFIYGPAKPRTVFMGLKFGIF